MSSGNYIRLAPVKFGFAWGIIGALSILLVGWSAWLWAYGLPFVRVMGSVYMGYTATFLGAIWGAIWAFIGSFVTGWLIALIYNDCCRCCCHSNSKSSGEPSV